MGIRDLFTKRQSNDAPGSTKVLVCSLGPKFAVLLDTDGKIYSQNYPSTTSKSFAGIDDLLNAIRNGYDVVHLFADVSSAGIIAGADGKNCLGTELINRCCDAGVKLL